MEPEKAQFLLKGVLRCLPADHWWLLHEKNPGDVGVATALNRQRSDIDSLLINSGFAGMNGHGFVMKKRPFESFRLGLVQAQSDLIFNNIRSDWYVLRKVNPRYKSASEQLRARARRPARGKLPPDLASDVDNSTSTRIDMDVKIAQQAIEKRENDHKKEEQRKQMYKEELARSVRYPVASAIISMGELSLRNPKVEKWAKDALVDILQLYADAKKDIVVKNSNGVVCSLLCLPKFQTASSTAHFIDSTVKVLSGDDRTEAEVAECIVSYLRNTYRLSSVDEELAKQKPMESVSSSLAAAYNFSACTSQPNFSTCTSQNLGATTDA